MKKDLKFAVIGGGSWATAIVKMLCENLNEVGWYIREQATLDHIANEQHNPDYLSSVEFNTEQLKLSNDINEIARYADVWIFVIPSAFIYKELEKLSVEYGNKLIVSAVKGIMPETGLAVGEYFHDIHHIPIENICVIGGPCHAEEVAMERLSYLTIACADANNAKEVASKLACHYIKTNISDDIIGIEYAAMLKNIYAIAAGIAHGLGYGDNFQSILMSNAIREMKRFTKKMHRIKRNINNSAYLGDLLVTGYSVFSRNRLFGNMIGKGYTVKSAQMEMNMVAEGYYATKSAFEMAQKAEKKPNKPIIEAVYDILYKNKEDKTVFKKLTDKLD